jgi:uncharacterized protein YlxP (DUF503 family)
MFVGVYELEIFIPSSSSLKDKRLVVKSIKDRIRNKFNVSIAEVDYQDKWQRAKLGIATVSNDLAAINQVFDEIFRIIESRSDGEITARNITIY